MSNPRLVHTYAMDKSKEKRLQQAYDAFMKKQYSSVRKAAQAFNVGPTPLYRRLRGTTPHSIRAYRHRLHVLTQAEESTLSDWICDMDQRGFPLRKDNVRQLARLLLSARNSSATSSISPVWESFIHCYLYRHRELDDKYFQKRDYERSKRDVRELVEEWYRRLKCVVAKYGILPEDIYNVEEIAFRMGAISGAKVICSSDIQTSNYARAIRSGNDKWVTAFVAANATGRALPPHIILAAEAHQPTQRHDTTSEYTTSVNENGWSTEDICLDWLQRLFEPSTMPRTTGRYRLLIMNGHSSLVTAKFDRSCMEKQIVPLYLPCHLSRTLQPMYASCFEPLKRLYSMKAQELTQQGIQTIRKESFLHLYPEIHRLSLSTSNIRNGFAMTNSVPSIPAVQSESQLDLQLTPPTTSSNHTQSPDIDETGSQQSPGIAETDSPQLPNITNNEARPPLPPEDIEFKTPQSSPEVKLEPDLEAHHNHHESADSLSTDLEPDLGEPPFQHPQDDDNHSHDHDHDHDQHNDDDEHQHNQATTATTTSTTTNQHNSGHHQPTQQNEDGPTPLPLSTVEQAVTRIVKCAELTMQNALSLQREIQQIRAAGVHVHGHVR